MTRCEMTLGLKMTKVDQMFGPASCVRVSLGNKSVILMEIGNLIIYCVNLRYKKANLEKKTLTANFGCQSSGLWSCVFSHFRELLYYLLPLVLFTSIDFRVNRIGNYISFSWFSSSFEFLYSYSIFRNICLCINDLSTLYTNICFNKNI